jgi:hypothetical protein
VLDKVPLAALLTLPRDLERPITLVNAARAEIASALVRLNIDELTDEAPEAADGQPPTSGKKPHHSKAFRELVARI